MQHADFQQVILDEEGFPLLPFDHSFSLRDTENGEILGEKVVALRRPPQDSSRQLRLFKKMTLNKSQPCPNSFLREHQFFSGFRIQEALSQHGNLRLRKGTMTYTRRPMHLPLPQIQTTKNSIPFLQTTSHKDCQDLNRYCNNMNMRPIFQVPRENLSNSHSFSFSTNTNKISVNIWEEFLLGQGALKKNGKYVVDQQNMMMERFRQLLKHFMSNTFANLVIYMIYFLFFFMSCCSYNNYLEALGYVLFHIHLRLHESAYENNMDLEFVGSLFQGPAYVFIRSWCQHCGQKENVKVFDNLMKKMKIDIITANKKN